MAAEYCKADIYASSSSSSLRDTAAYEGRNGRIGHRIAVEVASYAAMAYGSYTSASIDASAIESITVGMNSEYANDAVVDREESPSTEVLV